MKYFLFHKKADCPLPKKKKKTVSIETRKGLRVLGMNKIHSGTWTFLHFTQKPKLGN